MHITRVCRYIYACDDAACLNCAACNLTASLRNCLHVDLYYLIELRETCEVLVFYSYTNEKLTASLEETGRALLATDDTTLRTASSRSIHGRFLDAGDVSSCFPSSGARSSLTSISRNSWFSFSGKKTNTQKKKPPSVLFF